MQRYRMTQSPLQLKSANNVTGGVFDRSPKDGSIRPLYQPTAIKGNDTEEVTAAQPSPSASSPGPVARFFSRMVEQLVNDFASGAAATHPEAYLMWLDFNQADRLSSQRENEWVAGKPAYGTFNIPAEWRTEMQASFSQPHLVAASRLARPVEDFADATPVNREQAAKHSWLLSMIAAATAKIRQMRETRRCMTALHGMDDRMLKDIGISRYEIEQVSRYGRARK